MFRIIANALTFAFLYALATGAHDVHASFKAAHHDCAAAPLISS